MQSGNVKVPIVETCVGVTKANDKGIIHRDSIGDSTKRACIGNCKKKSPLMSPKAWSGKVLSTEQSQQAWSRLKAFVKAAKKRLKDGDTADAWDP